MLRGQWTEKRWSIESETKTHVQLKEKYKKVRKAPCINFYPLDEYHVIDLTEPVWTLTFVQRATNESMQQAHFLTRRGRKLSYDRVLDLSGDYKAQS